MEQRGKIISNLQARWRCELHSKDKDVPCWNENGSGICYALANHNLGYWAVEIVSNILFHISSILTTEQMSGNASVDIKPPTLLLHEAQPRTRHGPAVPTISHENSQSINPIFNFPGQFAMPQMHPFFMYPGQGIVRNLLMVPSRVRGRLRTTRGK
jgi:hypothetical protein